MLASTLIASFFVPMFFVILESLTERGSSGKNTEGTEPSGASATDAGEH
jgi:hypothetical protein